MTPKINPDGPLATLRCANCGSLDTLRWQDHATNTTLCQLCGHHGIGNQAETTPRQEPTP